MKNILFVDGTNLYAGQYDLCGPECYLDFSIFIQEIEESLKIQFIQIYVYASYSPKPKKLTEKIKTYLKNEALFYRTVKTTKDVTFFKGYRSLTSGKEKEVDVKMAVDIVDMAHRNLYDNVFVLSGDADFMHALYITKQLGKRVSIIALQNRIPFRFIDLFPTKVFIIKEKLFKQPKRGKKITLFKLVPAELIRKG